MIHLLLYTRVQARKRQNIVQIYYIFMRKQIKLIKNALLEAKI